MRILVAGHNGQVALALAERAASVRVEIETLGRPQLDLARPHTCALAIERTRPDVVVNAAAYTAVDKAESEAALAHAINAEGAGALAAAAQRHGVPIVHLSTDYVFDGTKNAPYTEDDPVAPCNAYGASKLAGEQAVAAANARHVILRTAWVYSPFGANFVKTMLRLAAERPQLRVVADQHGNPTSALDLADAILAIAARITREPDASSLWGTFHCTGSGETTWHGFASEIVALSHAHARRLVPVTAITTAEFPTPARRPANSRLDCSKLRRIYGLTLPPWRDSARACVERLCMTT